MMGVAPTGRCSAAAMSSSNCTGGSFGSMMTCPDVCDPNLGCVLCAPAPRPATATSQPSAMRRHGLRDVTCDPVQGMSSIRARAASARARRTAAPELHRLRVLRDGDRQPGQQQLQLRDRRREHVERRRDRDDRGRRADRTVGRDGARAQRIGAATALGRRAQSCASRATRSRATARRAGCRAPRRSQGRLPRALERAGHGLSVQLLRLPESRAAPLDS